MGAAKVEMAAAKKDGHFGTMASSGHGTWMQYPAERTADWQDIGSVVALDPSHTSRGATGASPSHESQSCPSSAATFFSRGWLPWWLPWVVLATVVYALMRERRKVSTFEVIESELRAEVRRISSREAEWSQKAQLAAERAKKMASQGLRTRESSEAAIERAEVLEEMLSREKIKYARLEKLLETERERSEAERHRREQVQAALAKSREGSTSIIGRMVTSMTAPVSAKVGSDSLATSDEPLESATGQGAVAGKQSPAGGVCEAREKDAVDKHSAAASEADTSRGACAPDEDACDIAVKQATHMAEELDKAIANLAMLEGKVEEAMCEGVECRRRLQASEAQSQAFRTLAGPRFMPSSKTKPPSGSHATPTRPRSFSPLSEATTVDASTPDAKVWSNSTGCGDNGGGDERGGAAAAAAGGGVGGGGPGSVVSMLKRGAMGESIKSLFKAGSPGGMLFVSPRQSQHSAPHTQEEHEPPRPAPPHDASDCHVASPKGHASSPPSQVHHGPEGIAIPHAESSVLVADGDLLADEENPADDQTASHTQGPAAAASPVNAPLTESAPHAAQPMAQPPTPQAPIEWDDCPSIASPHVSAPSPLFSM